MTGGSDAADGTAQSGWGSSEEASEQQDGEEESDEETTSSAPHKPQQGAWRCSAS